MKWSPNPRVYMLGQTEINRGQIAAMLNDQSIGADGQAWVDKADAPSAGEALVEVAGRLCYKSFEAGLNPNVTKVREGNETYIGNILDSKHTSVLEHASVTFGFIGVSRVFTHEIVRHRAGTAFSQESLRYVRLDDLDVWFPGVFQSDEVHIKGGEQAARDYTKGEIARREMVDGISTAERLYARLGEIFGIADMKDFNLKKKLTSAMRRIAPIGLSTNIVVTGNHRAWRHIIEVRTSQHAEEELRITMDQVASDLKSSFPNIYQDMEKNELGEWIFHNSKI